MYEAYELNLSLLVCQELFEKKFRLLGGGRCQWWVVVGVGGGWWWVCGYHSEHGVLLWVKSQAEPWS